MANRRAAFVQSGLTKVLKAFKDAGLPTPQIVIEPQRLTVSPMADQAVKAAPNPWDDL
jgi:hypothetical protein